MTLTAICSLESDRRKFFMNSTYIMSRKYESNLFGLRRPYLTPTAISSLESERGKFFINPTKIMSRK